MALVSGRFPFIPLLVRLPETAAGSSIEIEALVDTGFDGDVILPTGFLDSSSTPDFESTWMLADGSRVNTPVYVGDVKLIGLEGSHVVMISVIGDEPLVGRGLTNRFLLTLDHGRQLTIEA